MTTENNKKALLESSLKQGIITQEEFDAEMKKIQPSAEELVKNSEVKEPEQEEVDTLIDQAEADIEIEDEDSDPLEQEAVEIEQEKKAKKDAKKKSEEQALKEQTQILKEEVKEEKKEPPAPKKDDPHVDIKDDDEDGSFPWMWILAVIAILVGLSFCSMQTESTQDIPTPQAEITEPVEPAPVIEEPVIACSTDKDCETPDAWYECVNPGTEDSECVIEQAVTVRATAIVDRDCPTCSTARGLGLLSQWFPSLEVEEIDRTSAQAQGLEQSLDLAVFPAFIVDTSIVDTKLYEKIKQVFVQTDDYFVMKPTASGATWYGTRAETPGTIVTLVRADSTGIRALANVHGVVRTLSPQVQVIASSNECSDLSVIENAHCSLSGSVGCDDVSFSSCDQVTRLSTELGMNSMPYFLINNQLRVDGVQSADALKEAYCTLNDVAGCEEELATFLV